ncbi:hypothetical protein NDU88_007933 [Pleurodeles waltl]|uniref:Secreted protein n=1 Tax=Pleurodeles waltl TaxID=8319 RepID=A0AAV7PQA3_PLEWA|nr:hypothetical protein NDU88_007933 [Pleurodeles waltl]
MPWQLLFGTPLLWARELGGDSASLPRHAHPCLDSSGPRQGPSARFHWGFRRPSPAGLGQLAAVLHDVGGLGAHRL